MKHILVTGQTGCLFSSPIQRQGKWWQIEALVILVEGNLTQGLMIGLLDVMFAAILFIGPETVHMQRKIKYNQAEHNKYCTNQSKATVNEHFFYWIHIHLLQ